MTVGLFALPRYLTVILLCGAAYAIGRAILHRFKFEEIAAQLALCTALGLGIVAHLILLIGICGWLYVPIVVAAIVAAAAVAIVFRYLTATRDASGKKSDPGPWRWSRSGGLFCFALVGLALLPLALWPLYPPTEYDITAYHLAAPKHWLRIHTIDVTPFLRYQVGPNLVHTLFAALMAVIGDVPPQILSLAAICLIGAALYAWGKQLQGPAAGILAAALWMGSPATLELSSVASYHALAAFFAFVSIYALSMYVRNRQLGVLLMAGVLLGFAQATWLGVFSFVPALIAVSLYLCLRERRLAPLLVLGAGTLLGWGPTLLRSTWFTGNPIYPLLTNVFGAGPWWTADEFGKIEAYLRTFGVSRTLLNFVLLPYSLVMSPGLFQQEHGYSPALSLIAPFVLIHAGLNKMVRWLVALVIFYVACWFYFGQIMRYLLPIVPLFCLACALTLCGVGRYLSRHLHRSAFRKVATVVVAVVLLVPGAKLALTEVGKRGPVPLSEETRANYIAARIPEYKAVRVANADPGLVYGVGLTELAYYADGEFMGDTFGPGRYSQVLDNLENPNLLWRSLRSLGAKYLLIGIRMGLKQFPDGAAFDPYLEPIYGDSLTELFRVLDSPRSVPPERKNLLANAGFDELRDGTPVSWLRRGTPFVGTPEGGPISGDAAVEVSEADGFQQVVPVTAGETYQLGLQARSGARGKIFRLQVNWHNERGICDVSLRLFEATADWQGYVARLTAPSCATYAEVYASAHDSDWVWLDDFEFSDMGSHNPLFTTPRLPPPGIP